ncbi:hypothetical protein Taro_018147, partial [Colocasia esculenta]|nr:hypothetical protein [Colocasia esculenta]
GYGMWWMQWERVHLVRCTLYFCRPGVYADRVRLSADYAGCPGYRDHLPDYAGYPSDRYMDHLSPNSVTFPIPFSSSNFISKQRRYMFTRLEDLPQARVVWESTAQTNFRKLMWEAWDKAAKTTGSEDPKAWMDYGLVCMRTDYWESLCHHWATRPWQERSHAAKRNRTAHLKKNVHTSGLVSYATHNQKLSHELERAPTFHELFDRTHKRKGTDDYVSERARMISETYDRTMADRYVEGTPQLDLDPEAWVDAAGGTRKARVYGFGDNLDTTPVLSSYASSVAPPAYASSSAATPGNGGSDIRTLIQEELQLHLGAMVKQVVAAIRGEGPSQQAPEVSITINFI